MAFQDYPKIYSSMFTEGKIYDVTLVRRREIEKLGGVQVLHIQVNPEVYSKKQDGMISEGEWWFNPPGQKYHNEAEWAFLESISGVFDGGQFKIERTPTGLVAGGAGTTVPALPPAATAAPQPPAPTAQPAMPVTAVKSASPIGAVLDQCALMKFLWAQTEGEESIIAGERTDTVRQPLVSTLFIQACREGYDKGFRQWLEVAKAGNAPQVGEDGLPF